MKILKKELKMAGIYEENPKKADVILFNSYHYLKNVLRLKLEYQDKLFIHRIDGPIHLYRGYYSKIDQYIYEVNNLIADGTVFQSEWSKFKNYLLGFKKDIFEKVIINATDTEIFYSKKNEEIKFENKKRMNIIATSWSSNINKGFDLYQFLDRNLDFNRYAMKFIGQSSIHFKNIENIGLLKPEELAKVLRESDIYITGSKNDPCSNSLIEALSCGLPCVALNDGGHPEILKNGGELFNSFQDCLEKIELIKVNYRKYKNNIKIQNSKEVSKLYTDFIKNIYNKNISRKYNSKTLKLIDYFIIILKYTYNGFLNMKIMRNEIFWVLTYLRKKLQKNLTNIYYL